MEVYKETNLNLHIKFKKTSRTIGLYRDHMKALFGDNIPDCIPLDLEEDSEGYIKMQMWEAMQIFGKHFGRADWPTAISMDVLIEVKK